MFFNKRVASLFDVNNALCVEKGFCCILGFRQKGSGKDKIQLCQDF